MSRREELIEIVQAWVASFDEDVVVAIPVFNAMDDVLECVNSLLRHTPPTVPIVAVDDASTDHRVQAELSAIDDRRFLYVRKPENKGFVDTVNLIFVATRPHDVVIMNSDVVLPAEWFPRLRTAAYHRSNIATATPLTNHGTIVSVPERNRPMGELPSGLSLADIDDRIREHSLRLYPILPTAIGHCMYFRRTALDVVGKFDEIFAPGYGEEVDFSQRAVLAGFSHVLADDLFVYHKGSRSFSAKRKKIQQEHETIVNQRYPWYRSWVSDVAQGADNPLAQAIERARAAIIRYRIALDATCINGRITGTQKITLELIYALAQQLKGVAHLSLIVQDAINFADLHGLDTMVDAVIPLSQLQTNTTPQFDLLHRNFQLRSLQDYTLLMRVSRRLIISQLDFIAYANPGYSKSNIWWRQYRNLARWALGTADGVIFISEDAAADARHRGMIISDERQCVVSPGVDHHFVADEGVASFDSHPKPGEPFLLILGVDFRHKNRLFGLKILQHLRKRYQWDGSLVLAGLTATQGSSHQDEAEFLAQHPELEPYVLFLPGVTEVEKHWLLEHAALLLYPSVYEGFGLVPFEAAEVGTPVLASRMTSLAEVLGADVLALNSFNPVDGAEAAWALLSDDRLAARQIEAIRARAMYYTWQSAAQKMWDFYQKVLTLPPQPWRGQLHQMLHDGLIRAFITQSPTLPLWRQRFVQALWVLSTQGVKSLLNELWQYLKWVSR